MPSAALADINGKLKSLPTDERERLLRQLGELFVAQAARLKPDICDALGAMLGTVALGSGLDARRALAARLAEMPQAPHELMLRFAHDDISVAEAVLMWSEVLDVADLVGVALREGEPHLEVLARRPNVQAPVTDVITERGTQVVLRVLAANYTAALSAEGDARLLRRAAEDGVLFACLERRKAYLIAAKEKAERKAQGAHSADKLGAAVALDFAAALQTLRARNLRQPTAHDIAALAAERDASAALAAVALASGTQPDALARLLHERRLEPLAMALRAVGLTWSEAAGVLNLLFGGHVPTGELDRLGLMFRAATPAAARTVVRFLQTPA